MANSPMAAGAPSARPLNDADAIGSVSIKLGAEQFTKAFAQHGYGYASQQLLQSRGSQFSQRSGITYLDHAAATLCSKQQLQEAQAEQLQHLFANPHSQLPSGLDYSAMAIEELRLLTLNMLNAPADEYEVVFVAGATAALKLVGETFPWTPSSSICAYTTINHNSALGIRQQAAAAGATVTAVQVQQLQQSTPQVQSSDGSSQHQQQQQGQQQQHQQQQQQQGQDVAQAAVRAGQGGPYSLFIAPAECNMSGTRYNCVELFQSWKQLQQRQQSQQSQQQPQGPQQQEQEQQQQQQQQLQQQQQPQQHQQQQQQQQWLLLVDAAKACASHPPDCSSCSIDMLALSYYKIFGHPTGLGALVVRRRLLPLLHQHKAYFGGGTVEVVLPDSPHVVRRAGAAGLEDGTLPFTAIAAARHGFQQLQRLGGFPAISRHTACLSWHLMLRLLQLRHSTGGPVAVLYCHPAIQQLLQEHLTPALTQSAAASSSTSDSTSRVVSTGTTSTSSSKSTAGEGALGGFGTKDGLLVVPEASVMERFRELQGPVVCFNLLRPDGSWVGHKEVGKLAAIHSICLRTGCFCNPGACAHYLGLTSQDFLSHHAAGHVCWDDHDLIDGRPTGAVRASLGYMSSYEDVSVLLQFLQTFFVDNSGGLASTVFAEADSRTSSSSVRPLGVGVPSAAQGLSTAVAVSVEERSAGQLGHSPLAVDPHSSPTDQPAAVSVQQWTVSSSSRGHTSSSSTSQPASSAAVGCLTALYLYPVKSCAPQQVSAWPIGPNGLLYDREWAMCGPDGQLLTQKRVPRLTQVRAEVDLQQQVLRLTAVGVQQQLLVPLHAAGVPAAAAAAVGEFGVQLGALHQKQQQQRHQEVRVCGDRVCAQVLAGHVVGAAIEQPEPSAQGLAATAAASSSLRSPSMLQQAAGSDPAAVAVTAAAAGGDTAVQQWFAAAVGMPCRLVRQVTSNRTVKQQQQQQQHQQHVSPGAAKGFADSSTGVFSASLMSQTLGFANESQYLLVNQSSVDYVAGQLNTAGTAEAAGSRQAGGAGAAAAGTMHGGASQVDALRFRPNLVVSGFEPWVEDGWTGVRFRPAGSTQPARTAAAPAGSPIDAASCAGSCSEVQQQSSCPPTGEPKAHHHRHHHHQQQQQQQQQADAQHEEHLAGQAVQPGVCLQVVGPCGRCDMVSIDQSTGQRRGSQLLSLLARERRVGGKLQFGVLLANTAAGSSQQLEQERVSWLHVGDAVLPL